MRIADETFWKIMMINVAPRSPSPTVNIPATPPVRKAIRNAAGSDPVFAAAAVRTLPRTARLIPMKPVSPERKAPATNASVRYAPDWANVRTAVPSRSKTAVDVRKTTAPTGTTIRTMVRNWRFR